MVDDFNQRDEADKVDNDVVDNKIGDIAEVNEVDKVGVDKFDKVE